MVGGEKVSSISRSSGRFVSPVGWDLLGLLGFALFAVGGIDFVLTWFPARFGNPEWEFATVAAAMNGVPVPLFGLTLLLLSALSNESVGAARVLSVLFLVWAVSVVAMAVFYGLTLPIAAKGFAIPDIGIGLKKAIAKTLVQLLVYSVTLFWMGARGLKLARTISA